MSTRAPCDVAALGLITLAAGCSPTPNATVIELPAATAAPPTSADDAPVASVRPRSIARPAPKPPTEPRTPLEATEAYRSQACDCHALECTVEAARKYFERVKRIGPHASRRAMEAIGRATDAAAECITKVILDNGPPGAGRP